MKYILNTGNNSFSDIVNISYEGGAAGNGGNGSISPGVATSNGGNGFAGSLFNIFED